MIYNNLKIVSLKVNVIEGFKDEKEESEKFQLFGKGQGEKVNGSKNLERQIEKSRKRQSKMNGKLYARYNEI